MLLSAIMMGSLHSEPQSDGDLLGASRKRSLSHIPPVIFNYINPWANPLLPAPLHLSRLSRECLWVWLSPPTLRGLLGDFLFLCDCNTVSEASGVSCSTSKEAERIDPKPRNAALTEYVVRALTMAQARRRQQSCRRHRPAKLACTGKA